MGDMVTFHFYRKTKETEATFCSTLLLLILLPFSVASSFVQLPFPVSLSYVACFVIILLSCFDLAYNFLYVGDRILMSHFQSTFSIHTLFSPVMLTSSNDT